MEVVKLKNEIKYDQDNRFIKFIYSRLESGLAGDWTDNHKEGEEVIYRYDLNDDDWHFIDCSYNSLKEFIGEGITIIEEDDNLDLFYNIRLEKGILYISFNYIHPDKF
jgi:hypothetical protein